MSLLHAFSRPASQKKLLIPFSGNRKTREETSFSLFFKPWLKDEAIPNARKNATDPKTITDNLVKTKINTIAGNFATMRLSITSNVAIGDHDPSANNGITANIGQPSNLHGDSAATRSDQTKTTIRPLMGHSVHCQIFNDSQNATCGTQATTINTTSQTSCLIDNVAAAKNSLKSKAYVEALKTYCIYMLRGKRCTSMRCSDQSPLLCADFKKGTCPFTQFQHTNALVHILPNCPRAMNGKCFVDSCKLGYDNISLRRKRVEEKRKLELW